MEKFKIIDNIILDNINLKNLGFNHLEYMKDYNTGIFYQKNDEKVNIIKYGFGYNYRDYDPIKMAKEGFESWISFIEVENILQNILSNKSTVKNFSDARDFITYNEKTIFNKNAPDINKETIFCEAFKDKKILVNDIIEFMTEVNIFINEYLLTFFNEFSRLQDVNDKILEKYESSQWTNYIPGETYFKAIIIMKLCNNDKKYNQFTEIYKSRIYEGIQNGRSDVIPYYENLIKLMNYLESGKYKELI